MRYILKKRKNQSRERGIAIVATAAWLTVAIPLIGLGIDGSILWGAKTSITSACAAAAMAAARNLAKGDQLEQQLANATSRGSAFFQANFQAKSYGIAAVHPTIQVVQPSQSLLQVSATASADIPLYFMRYLGPNSIVAAAMGKATRRDVNLILVLERSETLAGPACEEIKKAARSFLGQLMGGRDRVGLVTFGSSATLDYPPNKTFLQDPDLQNSIGRFRCEGSSSMPDAYHLAKQQLLMLGEPGALNLIVLISTGKPDTFRTSDAAGVAKVIVAGEAQPDYLSDTDGNGLPLLGEKEVGTLTAGHAIHPDHPRSVRNAAHNLTVHAANEARRNGISTYAIGVDGTAPADPILLRQVSTGLLVNSPSSDNLKKVFARIESEILHQIQ